MGTVLFAFDVIFDCCFFFSFSQVKSSQVRKFFIPSKENVGATHKEQRCTYVKD